MYPRFDAAEGWESHNPSVKCLECHEVRHAHLTLWYTSRGKGSGGFSGLPGGEYITNAIQIYDLYGVYSFHTKKALEVLGNNMCIIYLEKNCAFIYLIFSHYV